MAAPNELHYILFQLYTIKKGNSNQRLNHRATYTIYVETWTMFFPCLKVRARLTISFNFLALASKSLLIPALVPQAAVSGQRNNVYNY